MSQHRKWMHAAGLAAALTFSVVVQAQDVKRLEAVADSFAATSKFSGTVLVAKGDRVLLDKGYGSANLEWNIPNAPSTKFRLGSVTKQFTAAGVLLLEDRGKLKVSEPVSKYLPDLPAAWSKITIAQLLNHTSGIANFTSQKEYQSIEPFTKKPAEIAALVRDLPLRFESGSKFEYSNTGYVLLGQLIEQVSGDSYATFLRKNIFEPLGMKDTGYDWNAAILPNRAAGYARGKSGIANAGFINMSIPHGAGALYSTTADLLRWQRALYEGKLLSAGALQAMTTAYESGYGYGLAVREAPGSKELAHNGGIEGFSTELHYRVADKISVIVLSNVEGSQLDPFSYALSAVARGDTTLLPSERKAVALTPEQVSSVLGAYAMPNGRRFWVRERGGQMTARLDGQRALPVYAESPDRFFGRLIDAQGEIKRNAAGAVESITLVQGGRRIPMLKVPDVEPDYDTAALYLRGDMNEWGIRDRLQKTGAGSYAATIELAPGRYDFKVGSEDFKTVDLGGLEDDQQVALGAAQVMDAVGPNLSVEIPRPGKYTFILNVANAQEPVINVAPAAP
ncbi:serine hydrolase [Duganella hordei]|uniref:serine hydrolase n=1 Tax=Duganella hordei TaxID=2865934 RepID=UPI0030E8B45E